MCDKLKLSVVIPTHNRVTALMRLLDSIGSQKIDLSMIEVIVVSNLRNQKLESNIKDWIAEDLLCRYFEVGKVGVNLARNLGIQKSCGEILLFLDDDCELHDNQFLRILIELHKKWSDVAGIGGCYVLPTENNLYETAYQWVQDMWLERGTIDSSSTSALIGGNASFKRHMIGEYLRYDNNIDFGGAETELNLRLIRNGFLLRYSDLLRVTHRSELNLSRLMYKAFKQGVSAQKRATAGLEFRTGRPMPSYECVIWKYENLSAWNSFCLYLILKMYNYIFFKGRVAGSSESAAFTSQTDLWLLMIKAPYLKWIGQLLKQKVKSFVLYLKFSQP